MTTSRPPATTDTGTGSKTERVWNPLDINGLRLYRVHIHYIKHPHLSEDKIVAANSPSNAAGIVRKLYGDVDNIITGYALYVLQPKGWTK